MFLVVVEVFADFFEDDATVARVELATFRAEGEIGRRYGMGEGG